jgi:hypothetical protein
VSEQFAIARATEDSHLTLDVGVLCWRPTPSAAPTAPWPTTSAASRDAWAEGIVAGAHKLACIIWALIVSGKPYDQAKAFAISAANTAK